MVLDQYMPQTLTAANSRPAYQQMGVMNQASFESNMVPKQTELQQMQQEQLKLNQVSPQATQQQMLMSAQQQNNTFSTFMQDPQQQQQQQQQQQELIQNTAANQSLSQGVPNQYFGPNPGANQIAQPSQILPVMFDHPMKNQNMTQMNDLQNQCIQQQVPYQGQSLEIMQAENDFDQTCSDQEPHVKRGNRRRQDRMFRKQPQSLEVGSGDFYANSRPVGDDKYQRQALPRTNSPHHSNRSVQAYDLASAKSPRHQSRPWSQQNQKTQKQRRLPQKPEGLGPLHPVNLQTPQSSDEHLSATDQQEHEALDDTVMRHRSHQQKNSFRADPSNQRDLQSTRGIKQKSTSRSTQQRTPVSNPSKGMYHSTGGAKDRHTQRRTESITDSEPEEELEDNLEDIEMEEDSTTQESNYLDRPTTPFQSKARDQNSSADSKGKKKATSVPKRETSESSKKSNPTQADDKALYLLNELKLTEQANQVMEHQQLLIKQSQELIKLQQAQLEQKNAATKATSEKEVSPPKEQKEKSESAQVPQESRKSTNDEDLGEVQNQEGSNELCKGVSNKDTSHSTDDSSNLDRQLMDKGSKNQSRSEDAGKVNTQSINEATSESRDHGQRSADSQKDRIKKSTNSTNAHHHQDPLASATNSHTALSANRPRRDLLQSPTDTTDSDLELTASNRRSARPARNQGFIVATPNSRSRSLARRREPVGLPPSPLPVAAAIQLHQMQQQHMKNQPQTAINRGPSALNRTGYLRSRSVTSSPNHMFERSPFSGYSTDNQHNRPTSPDTMSEYGGGARRRRRLPEPPSNAVPLTPSMVRKMIQAQKAAATSSSKLLTSVNAQSTMLTNMHSTRNPSFDRLPSDRILDSGLFYHNQLGDRNLSKHQSVSFAKVPGQAQKFNPSPYVKSDSNRPPASGPLSGSSMLSQSSGNPNSKDLSSHFQSHAYDRSLIPTNIADPKDTIELDKLISNLDGIYALDRKRNLDHSAINLAKDKPSYLNSTSFSPKHIGHTGSAGLYPYQSSLLSSQPTRPSYRFGQTDMLRRNSEGESLPLYRSLADSYRTTIDHANRSPIDPNQSLDSSKPYALKHHTPGTHLSTTSKYYDPTKTSYASALPTELNSTSAYKYYDNFVSERHRPVQHNPFGSTLNAPASSLHQSSLSQLQSAGGQLQRDSKYNLHGNPSQITSANINSLTDTRYFRPIHSSFGEYNSRGGISYGVNADRDSFNLSGQRQVKDLDQRQMSLDRYYQDDIGNSIDHRRYQKDLSYMKNSSLNRSLETNPR